MATSVLSAGVFPESEAQTQFSPKIIISSTADSAISVFAADIDGDGDIDALSASRDDDKIAWYENDGSGSFALHTITTSADGAFSVFAIDLDDDGDTDVLSASAFDNKIAWYENDGSENFTLRTIATDAIGPWSVIAADINGDGHMDALSASTEDDKIAWYENDGSENFTLRTITTNANSARSVFAAEVDGDGQMDVLSASGFDDRVVWYDGSDNFAPHDIATNANLAIAVIAIDLDRDGDTDVLSASRDDDKIAWYENDGSENFSLHTITTSADAARSVFAADLDLDGDIDVLSASRNDDKIAWYENDGSESFMLRTITTSSDFAYSVFAADFDGDGDLDVLAGSTTDDTIAWFENQLPTAEIVVLQQATEIIDGGTDNLGMLMSGATHSRVYTVGNNGTAELLLSPPTAGNFDNVANFTVSMPPPEQVPIDAGVQFTIEFDVLVDGLFGFDLELENSDRDENPYNIFLVGEGVGGSPEIGIFRSGMAIGDGTIDDLGARMTGGTHSSTYTVENTGTADLALSLPAANNLDNVANFSVVTPPPSGLAPGASAVFIIEFDVLVDGAFGLDLQIDNDDDDENPYDIKLVGTGTAGAPEIEIRGPDDAVVPDMGTLDIGAQSVGPVAQNLQVLNTGSGNLSVGTPAAGSTENVRNVSVSVLDTVVAPASSTTLQPSFTVPAAGPFSVRIEVPNSDSDEANYDFQIIGAGIDPPTTSASISKAEVLPGDIVKYTVEFDVGPVSRTDVSLGLDVPEGLTLVAGSLTPDLGGNINSGNGETDRVIDIDYGAVVANDTRTITFEGSVADPFLVEGATLLLGGNLFVDDLDPVPVQRSDVVTISGTADVTVLMTDTLVLDNDGDGKANPSDILRFDVIFKNTGAQTSEPLSFRLVAPSGTTPIDVLRQDVDRVPIARIGVDSQTGQPTIEAEISEVPNSFENQFFRFVLLINQDATPRPIAVQGVVTGANTMLHTDDSVPFNSVPEEPNIVEVGNLARLQSPDSSEEESGFGAASAASGNLLVIGEPDDNAGEGSVSVFRIAADGSRQFLRKITPPAELGDTTNARFGAALAFEDGRLVIGAPGPTGTSSAKGPPSGNKVGLFSMGSDGIAALVAAISQNLDSDFGSSVSLDGTTVAIGAPMDAEGEEPTTGSGAVLFYDFNASNTGPLDKIKPAAPQAGQRFGSAVAARNGKFVVGAPGPEGIANSGRAMIYDLGTKLRTDLASGMDGRFGASVAISGARIAVGAPMREGGGSVFEYDLQGTSRGMRVAEKQQSGWMFGQAVAFDGDQLVVGAPQATADASEQNNVISKAPNGAVYIFAKNGTQFSRIGAFPTTTTELVEQKGFGASIAVAEDLLVIGAPDSRNGIGAAAVRVSVDVLFASGFEN